MARKKLSRSPLSTILVVTSNQASQLFFSQMRKDCRYANLTVSCLEGSRNLRDFINKVARMRNRGGYTIAWAEFDFDDFHVTTEEVREAESYAGQKKVRLGWNNPSQALWYLLHFQSPRGLVTDAKVFEEALSSLVKGYGSGPEYLLTEGLAFHLSLYPYKSRAANNASMYNRMAESQTGLPATNMILLLNDITSICGKADITHNQRQLGQK